MAAREEPSASFYYFDDVVVDRENFRVLKAGEARMLEPKIFDLLIFLIENRGRVLEKQELFKQVWKQAFVTDNALTRAIKEIRRALGDDASAPRYIETIPKRGYRFIARVESPPETAQPERVRPETAHAETARFTTARPELASTVEAVTVEAEAAAQSLAAPDQPPAPAIIQSARRVRGSSKRMATLLVAALMVVAVVVWLVWRQANRRWARAQIPRIEELAQARKYFEAFDLAVRAERYLPGDPALEKLMPMVADPLSVTTEPSGARVYLRRFMPDTAGANPMREMVGTSPINNLRIARGDYLITIEKDGYAPFERTLCGGLARVGTALMPPSYALSRIPDIPIDEPFNLALKLIEANEIPDRMVFVPGGKYQLVSWGKPTKAGAPLDGFFIDKFEVTNREYKEFINAGGYLKKTYWHLPFIKAGKPVSWEEAMQQFCDRTRLAGPRSWAGQDFPEGKGDHPVTDITWYEAAAYAAFRGKQLPSIFQWEKAARDGVFTHYSATIMPWGPVEPGGTVELRANFKSAGTAPVGSFEFGMSPYGCYHMAGNVAEWCRNEVTGGFATAGGSWEDFSYLFSSIGVFPGLYSSTRLGFRCVVNTPAARGDQGSGRIDLTAQVPAYAPTAEANFNAWLSHYGYDKTPLDAELIDVTETDVWRREKLAFKGADDERVIAYLYLPKNALPPFQVMQFLPAGDVYGGYITIAEATEILLAPFIKSGRAVFAVVFKGFKEREHPADYVSPSRSSVRFREAMVNHAIDLRRGLDYLETRPDIDARRLIYYGYSQGAEEGLIYTAVEDRYRAVVLVAGGVKQPDKPWIAEAWPLNFASHIRAPKLMLNGRYDEAYPHKTDVEPLYKLLREPKRLIVYEAGHTPPIEIAVPVVNDWLNETLGPIKRE